MGGGLSIESGVRKVWILGLFFLFYDCVILDIIVNIMGFCVEMDNVGSGLNYFKGFF